MKTEAQSNLAALLEAIAAAEPGPRIEGPEGTNMFNRGKVMVNLHDREAEPIWRDMTSDELAQEAAAAEWGEKNHRHHLLRQQVDAAAKSAFDSLPQEAQVAFLQAGPHRWSGGEDARFARFKVVLAHGGTEVGRLGAGDSVSNAKILISAAADGVETDELIARLAGFEF